MGQRMRGNSVICADAYGGGAAVITAREIRTIYTSQWIDEQPWQGAHNHFAGPKMGEGWRPQGEQVPGMRMAMVDTPASSKACPSSSP